LRDPASLVEVVKQVVALWGRAASFTTRTNRMGPAQFDAQARRDELFALAGDPL
jgi:hypothetical protein